MIEITDETRLDDLSEEQIAELTSEQMRILLERDLVDENGMVRLS